jgi:hemerythrin-like domain-containing protein
MPVQIGQPEPGFDDPVGLLTACHRRIERFLAVLTDITTRLNGTALPENERRAMENALTYFRDAAPHHTADEESGLFPTLEQTCAEAVSDLLALERDHRRAEELHSAADRIGMTWIQRGTLDTSEIAELQAALTELSSLYREHIRIEEERVFPRARKALSQEIFEKIGRDMASRRGVAYEVPCHRS